MTEHFIPLRRSDLMDLLCAAPEQTAEERELFRQFCGLLIATIHFDCNLLLEKLKGVYVPFDPDNDTLALKQIRAEERQHNLNDLVTEFGWMMERANFKHLSRDEMEPSLGNHTAWGLRMDVDFRMFERLALFIRGVEVQRRLRRKPGRLWRQVEVEVPVYQRLVMILKLRPHPRLSPTVDTSKVYLQIFKDIPMLDINMLLPGARVRFSLLDRGKITFPILSGLFLTGWKILTEITSDIASIVLFQHPAALWTLVTGTVGYGLRSYYGYYQTKQQHNLSLTQVLYFQNLDTNAGVLFRVMKEAEEEECREAMLMYHVLWRAGEQGCSRAEFRERIDRELKRLVPVQVTFNLDKVLARLEKLHLVEKVGEQYRARPIRQALEALVNVWDGYCKQFHPQVEQHLSAACGLASQPERC